MHKYLIQRLLVFNIKRSVFSRLTKKQKLALSHNAGEVGAVVYGMGVCTDVPCYSLIMIDFLFLRSYPQIRDLYVVMEHVF